MTSEITIVTALAAGAISFLSPCVLPLVPPYLAYLAGTSLEHVAEDERPAASRRATILAALIFIAGFSTVFIALGAAALYVILSVVLSVGALFVGLALGRTIFA